MLPFLVLTAVTLLLRIAGGLGIHALNSWIVCLRLGLFTMFLVTATAHWGKRRNDLIAMVPTAFPNAALTVSITGLLEITGAVGLLFPSTAPLAAACLIALLIAMFPANIRAARAHLKIGDSPATPLPLRTLLQIVFIAALAVAGFPALFESSR